MYFREVTVKATSGLHARPASVFVGTAGKYKSTKITIGKAGNDENVNAKSIVMVLSLSIEQGDTIRISAVGEKEEEAVEGLVALVENEVVA